MGRHDHGRTATRVWPRCPRIVTPADLWIRSAPALATASRSLSAPGPGALAPRPYRGACPASRIRALTSSSGQPVSCDRLRAWVAKRSGSPAA